MKYSTDPIAQLMQEHNDALLRLKQLNKAVQAVNQEGYSPKQFRQIDAALKFMKVEVTVHNRKEEDALFPVLERYVDGPTRIMRSDHRRLRTGFERLNQAVKHVKKRRDSFSGIRRLRSLTAEVVQLFVNHIHKENHILFPLVQQFLSKEELREIAKKMI